MQYYKLSENTLKRILKQSFEYGKNDGWYSKEWIENNFNYLKRFRVK